ncbi:MAG: dephospho-CoA kinase [Candidatus Krumholzibacteria bacterium]|jgi:dephospho-CoA kinase|nr:dephospho-CoA kinase [Candidatus Krumholzibacteria bacterium]
MGCPLIVVTGGIASGKTTVARVMAAAGGCLLDADTIARTVYRDPLVREKVGSEFAGVLTPGGRISRKRLGRAVFGDPGALARLESIVKPHVKRTISGIIRQKSERERYIVLDAVLYFQYKFLFPADLSVQTRAAENIRAERLAGRDGMSAAEARARVESQRPLYKGWEKADITLDTSAGLGAVRKKAAEIRDGFLKSRGVSRKDDHE